MYVFLQDWLSTGEHSWAGRPSREPWTGASASLYTQAEFAGPSYTIPFMPTRYVHIHSSPIALDIFLAIDDPHHTNLLLLFL